MFQVSVILLNRRIYGRGKTYSPCVIRRTQRGRRGERGGRWRVMGGWWICKCNWYYFL